MGISKWRPSRKGAHVKHALSRHSRRGREAHRGNIFQHPRRARAMLARRGHFWPAAVRARNRCRNAAKCFSSAASWQGNVTRAIGIAERNAPVCTSVEKVNVKYGEQANSSAAPKIKACAWQQSASIISVINVISRQAMAPVKRPLLRPDPAGSAPVLRK